MHLRPRLCLYIRKIMNSAGNGRYGYTSRTELVRAYAAMLTEDKHNGKIYNLMGEAITQAELINTIYGT